ncbi:hypothetical protein M1614_01435 [Candidatus Marsarchaeota archaeon]|jgi:DNA-directed RNA polymerase subunit F|nr:hypothetical protein [Candidatus Marsarchaeota archaeon]MCL5089678.1 hypothetical protein [Candidatus Marsarchaeota archaeon]
MIGKEIKNNGNVSLSDVWEILEDRRKKDSLIYEQQIALEHAKKFKLPEQDYTRLMKKLEESGTLKSETIIKLIDIKPQNIMILKQVLMSEKKEFSESELKTLLDIFKE